MRYLVWIKMRAKCHSTHSISGSLLISRKHGDFIFTMYSLTTNPYKHNYMEDVRYFRICVKNKVLIWTSVKHARYLKSGR